MSTQLAYIAGLFDGEGSVDYAQRFVKKRENRPNSYKCWSICCTVSMTDKPVVKWLQETLQLGTICLRVKNKSPSSKPHWKDQWRWRCRHRDAYKFAKLIISYTHVKREKLQQIINHYENKNDKLSIRYTDDRDVRVHNAVSGDGHYILNEQKRKRIR